ncbi:unnamed protein product [Enterobius vermicularis]|uniref:C-type lectin domain-containing protein n=1 Tax=Enterobius vermicularis TaxID=51028 RepID=A0A158QAB2_ENTVE|nr:unnamed protein product [Enterobius vermicularis]
MLTTQKLLSNDVEEGAELIFLLLLEKLACFEISSNITRKRKGRSCFLTFSFSEKVTWDEAQRHCEARRSYLATFDSALQYRDISKELARNPFWFGFRKNAKGWEWVDLQTPVYSEMPTESNDVLAEFHCAYGTQTGAWNTALCSERMEYICEFRR